MKSTIIKIAMIMAILLFSGAAASFADGRKYYHRNDKHTYKAKLAKTTHYRHNRAGQHHRGYKKRYYMQRPVHSVVRHHYRYDHHCRHRPFCRFHHHHCHGCYRHRHGYRIFIKIYDPWWGFGFATHGKR